MKPWLTLVQTFGVILVGMVTSNLIKGTIPDKFDNLPNLESFNFDGLISIGTIPESLGKSKN